MKNPVLKKAIALAMGASLAVSVPVLAADKEDVVKDGTYTKVVKVVNDGRDDNGSEWSDYDLAVTLTVENGKIASITGDPGEGYDDGNDSYLQKALKKGKSINVGLKGQEAKASNVEAWDATSGATITAEAAKQAVLDLMAEAPAATDDAKQDDEKSEGVYVLMNIPYAQFYGTEETNNFDTDAMSSATNKVGNVGFAGGGYHSAATAGTDADGNVTAVGGENGAHMEGVTWPVKAASLDDVKALGGTEVTDETKVTVATAGHGATTANELTGAAALTEAPGYSYYVLSAEPAYYFDLTVSDGKAAFSALQGEVRKQAKISDVEPVYTSHWGDVELDLTGAVDTADKKVNAIVLTAEDGTKGGMVHLYNIWKSADLAWDADQVKGLDGKKLTNARFYMTGNDGNYYVLDYPMEVEISDIFTDGAQAEFVDEKTVELTGLPEDIKDAEATVSYTTGSKKDRVTTYATPEDGSAVAVKDGKVALTTAADPEQTYTVLVNSDNYAPITLTAKLFNGGYVLLNIPYEDFYGTVGTTNLDADAMSSATNKVGNTGKAGGGYHDKATAKKNDDGSYTAVGGENGATMLGVTWPVKADSLADLKALKGSVVTDDSKVVVATLGRGQTSSTTVTGAAALMEAPSYSYYALAEEPAQYFEMTVKDGKASFEEKTTAEKLDKLDITVSYGTNWGDIQFDYKTPEALDGKQLNALVITAEDGKNAGMVHLYNAWANNSLAWKVANISDLDGKKITNLRFYVNDKEGNYEVYDVPTDTEIVPVYTGEVTAEFDDQTTVSLTGLPEDIENPRAKVYLKGQGRGAKSTYLTPEEVDPADGDIDPVDEAVVDNKVPLKHETNKAEDGVTYTVVVASDNYAPISTTATYTEKQEEPTPEEPDTPAAVLNGIVKGPDGKWALYEDNEVKTSYTGIAKNNYGWWRIKDGYVDFNANGIYRNEYGWWKTKNGKVTFEETGIFKNEYGWWRVVDSKVDFNANGIYRNDYGWWKTKNGKVTFQETGVFKNEYGWWRVENSKVNFKANGLYSNQYGTWYVKNGKVDFNFNGTYQGKTIKNGKVVK